MTIITSTKAASILGCDPTTVARMCRDGTLTAQRLGNQWAIDEADCEQFATRYVNDKKPWRVEGTRTPKSISISPTSNGRRRKPGHVGLYLAIQKVLARRPDLVTAVGDK